jgi:tetratricopeptide (TPR) repeat protein
VGSDLLAEDTLENTMEQELRAMDAGRPTAPTTGPARRTAALAAFVTQPLIPTANDYNRFTTDSLEALVSLPFVVACFTDGLEAGFQMLDSIHAKGWQTVLDELSEELADSGAPGVEAFGRAMSFHTGGQLRRAEAAYREAIASGNPAIVPVAALGLGNAFQDQGRLGEAEAAYRQALDDQEQGGLAAYSLGTVLEAQGQVADAEAFYQRAMESTNPDAYAGAALALGTLMGRQGRIDEAVVAFQQATASGHEYAAPAGALSLGALLQERGQLDEARAAYQQALQLGLPPEGVEIAADGLRRLDRGEPLT